jgi:adenosine deaminase
MTKLQSFPKIELHLHLDCSLSFAAVIRLNPGVSRAEYERDYIAPARCPDLATYLKRAPMGFRLMQTGPALAFVVEDLFEQLAADGVIYAELRFAPLQHTEQGLSPEEVVAAVDRATETMIQVTGIEARIILCTLRHFSLAQSMATVELVKRFQGSHVVALDLAGDEGGYPLDAHRPAFQYAIDQGLFRTAHAGEARGPESVWETLRDLYPQRIGHGTRSIEDPKLVDHLWRSRVHLELCPSANVQIIPSIESWAQHPIDRLYRAGVRLNVNTDSRMLTPATLTGEYTGLERTFGWGDDEFLTTNLMAINAAFVESAIKEKLITSIQKYRNERNAK